jgi:polynucleotide 5'-kinase involved in rRNA processing
MLTLFSLFPSYGRDDPDLIRNIVEVVLKKFHRRHPFEVNKKLVGIENKHGEIESSLKIESNDVRILALWGMGGIGKTTLAKSLYDKHYSQFERHCFLKNVWEVVN